ncbi:MAG: signal peptidase I [Planctomycetes bacterium]|nr:signal peptidase I [Planctomycetota bacterium]
MDDLTWYLLAWASITVPGVLLGWLRVFPKAGHPAWAALLPFYNVYVLVVDVARLGVLWFVLVWVPVIQLVAVILVNVEVAKRFGRSEAFGLGLTLLGFVFYPVLGFGSDRYQEGTAEPVGPV